MPIVPTGQLRHPRGPRSLVIAVLLVAGVVRCTATPLPLPPELDESRMELWSRGQEQVLFIGQGGALQPPTSRQMLVTNLTRGGAVLFITDFEGGFEVGLAGDLEDTYRFTLPDEPTLETLLDCTSVGSGGVRDIDDEPPPPDPTDQDGDGFPAAEDCDDNDASVGPASPEICDGLDNDCDGEVDEEGCSCGADGDCSDGLYCTGQETCAVGTCRSGVAVDCDDGDPVTLDYCSEPDGSCIHE